MLSDEELNAYRVNGTKVRVIRDNVASNDVRGVIVAWNEDELIIRKQNRNVVKLPRQYTIIPADADRPELL